MKRVKTITDNKGRTTTITLGSDIVEKLNDADEIEKKREEEK